MKNARKIFSAVVITLLAIVMLLMLAGCDVYIHGCTPTRPVTTEPMSVRISFGSSFMEAAGVKPQE